MMAGAGATVLNGVGFVGGGNDVTVANMTLRNFKTAPGSPGTIDSGLDHDAFDGWQVLNNEVYGSWQGIIVGSRSLVQNNYVHDSQSMGIGLYAYVATE